MSATPQATGSDRDCAAKAHKAWQDGVGATIMESRHPRTDHIPDPDSEGCRRSADVIAAHVASAVSAKDAECAALKATVVRMREALEAIATGFNTSRESEIARATPTGGAGENAGARREET